MKIIKKLLLFSLVIIVFEVGLYGAKIKGYLKNTPIDQLTTEELKFFSEDAKKQAQILTDRAKETGDHIQQVLGESIQINEKDGKPVHQKTLEYGRYLYCQQVVKEWEANHPED